MKFSYRLGADAHDFWQETTACENAFSVTTDRPDSLASIIRDVILVRGSDFSIGGSTLIEPALEAGTSSTPKAN